MTGDSVSKIFTPESIEKLPKAWRASGLSAFKQLCLSHSEELAFRRRARETVFWLYIIFLVVFGSLNVAAAVGWIHIVEGWAPLVREIGGGSFATLAIGMLAQWIAPHLTRE